MTQTDVSRAHYTDLRRTTGSPSMILFKISEDVWYVEASTGEVMFAQLSGACNAWEAKSQGVLEWSNRHNPQHKFQS